MFIVEGGAVPFERVSKSAYSLGFIRLIALALLGGIILFVYGIIPTLQPANFGRVYAVYGEIFIVSSLIWGRIVDKKTT